MLRVRPIATDADWQACRSIRHRVFVEEQDCPPEEEWDAHDETARHLVGELDGRPVATSRWRVVEHEGTPTAKLERFAVLPHARGDGHGRALVAATIADAEAAGHARFLLYAQAHLQRFYAGFGFAPCGAPFQEAGIPHVPMHRLR